MTLQQQAHTVCQRFKITTPNLQIGGKRPNHHGGMVTHGTYVTGLPISMGDPTKSHYTISAKTTYQYQNADYK